MLGYDGSDGGCVWFGGKKLSSVIGFVESGVCFFR